ncbi:MAG: Hsp20/alpha crystallin family protein [Bacteroidales bacterium]|nr:Hsp20/alpha crystallin family protein [Bacteroidales bacterium]
MTTMISKNPVWFPRFMWNDLFDNTWMDSEKSTSTPAVNVRENEDGYLVELATPGMTKNDLNIKIDENDVLTVSMEHKEEKKEQDKKGRYLRREFSYSQFAKSLALPEDADRKAISAKIENGVLEISIPKKEEAKEAHAVKTIEIQ